MLGKITGCKGNLKIEVAMYALEYLFGVLTKSKLKALFAEVGLDKDAQVRICNDTYIMRNCKFYVYAKHVDPDTQPADYGIYRSDVVALDYIASKLRIRGCKPWSLDKLDTNEHYLVSKELKVYIRKFVYKKMSFLIKSYGLTMHDLETELFCHAIFTLRKKYPFFKSDLHAINTVKTAVHNKGIDLILKYTRKKNQRLMKNNDGTFEARNVDLSTLANVPAPEPFELRMKDEKDSLHYLQKLMNGRGAKFISLARGDYDKEFSEWLGMNNTHKAEMNYPVYLNCIRKYLGVTQEETDKFLNKVRKHLI